ncbi:hypothetical protein HDE_11145 [Halotydeus destructor]|nr:hypothetical protein HDE_11145 [Halotydeus destructor]
MPPKKNIDFSKSVYYNKPNPVSPLHRPEVSTTGDSVRKVMADFPGPWPYERPKASNSFLRPVRNPTEDVKEFRASSSFRPSVKVPEHIDTFYGRAKVLKLPPAASKKRDEDKYKPGKRTVLDNAVEMSRLKAEFEKKQEEKERKLKRIETIRSLLKKPSPVNVPK